MSLDIINNFNNAMHEKYGVGVEAIVLSEYTFDRIVSEVAIHLPFNKSNRAASFYTAAGEIKLTKSNQDEIKRTKVQISELQKKLDKLESNNV